VPRWRTARFPGRKGSFISSKNGVGIRWDRILATAVLMAAVLPGVLRHQHELPVLAAVAAVIRGAILNNRMMGYVEERIYGNSRDEE